MRWLLKISVQERAFQWILPHRALENLLCLSSCWRKLALLFHCIAQTHLSLVNSCNYKHQWGGYKATSLRANQHQKQQNWKLAVVRSRSTFFKHMMDLINDFPQNLVPFYEAVFFSRIQWLGTTVVTRTTQNPFARVPYTDFQWNGPIVSFLSG